MFRIAITVLLATTAVSASATSFFNNTTGLTGSFTTVDLTTPTLSSGALVTSEYASQGITFSNATYDPQPIFYSGPSIGNFNGTDQFPDISFTYSPSVSNVAFRYISNIGTSTFDAYLGATLVASTTFTTGVDITQWYGVTGGGFDRIVITAPGNNALLATDFQIGSVPEPASWAMLIAGFGLVGTAARRRRMASAA